MKYSGSVEARMAIECKAQRAANEKTYKFIAHSPIKRLFETTLHQARQVSGAFYLNLLSHNREWIKLIFAERAAVSLRLRRGELPLEPVSAHTQFARNCAI